MSPSATRPASRRAAAAAGAASPGDSSRIIVRATVGRAAGTAPDAPGPTEPRHPDGGVGSPPNRAAWGGAGASGAPGGAAPDRSRPDPPPRAGMGARRPAPDHCAAASGAAAPSAH